MNIALIWCLPDRNPLYTSFLRLANETDISITPIYYKELIQVLGLPGFKDYLFSLLPSCDFVIISLYELVYGLTPEFVHQVNAAKPVVLWQADDEIHFTTQTVNYLTCVSVLVTTDRLSQPIAQEYPILCLLHPFFNSDFPCNPQATPKDIDVLFVGNPQVADRMQYISYLRRHHVAVRVPTELVTDYNGRLSRHDFCNYIRRSRICLNFCKTNLPSRILTVEPWRSYIRQSKGRPFEIAALGSFCLSESSHSLGSQFHEGKEIATFDTQADLLSQTRYYLSHPDIREDIAQSMHARYCNDYNPTHLFKQTINDILSYLNSRPYRSSSTTFSTVQSAFLDSTSVLSAFTLARSVLAYRRPIASLQLFISLLPVFTSFRQACLTILLCLYALPIFRKP